MASKLWTKEETEILKNNYEKIETKELVKMLPNRTYGAILCKANKMGLRYISYNKNYFEKIDSEDKAYWLGMIYADGNVSTGDRFTLGLKAYDKYHLEKMIEHLDSNIRIKTQKLVRSLNGAKEKEYYFSRFTICSPKFCNDLIDKGVLMKKTNVMFFPNEEQVPKHLVKHFIRGFMDGDGSYGIYDYKVKRSDRHNRIYDRTKLHLDYTCNSMNFIEGFNDFIKKELGLDFKICKKKGSAYSVRLYDTKHIEKFIKYIYDEETISLVRKKDIAVKILDFCKKKRV